MNWAQALISAIGLLGGGVGIVSLLTVVAQRKKISADAADVITDTALTLVGSLKERVGELEAEAAGLRDTLRRVRREFDGLLTELHGARTEYQLILMAIMDPLSTLDSIRDLARSRNPS